MNDDRDIFVAVLVFIIVVALCVLLALWSSSVSCSSHWKSSGMKTDWSLFGGCQIEVSPGHWIPEERYREIDK